MSQDPSERGGERSGAQRQCEARGANPCRLTEGDGDGQEPDTPGEQRVREGLEARGGDLDQGGHSLASGPWTVGAIPDEEGHDLQHHADDGERGPAAEDDDRVFLVEKRAPVGVRFTIGDSIKSELSGGYAYDRSVRQGTRMGKKERGTLDLGNSWFVGWNLRAEIN